MTREAAIPTSPEIKAHKAVSTDGFAYFEGRYMPVQEANVNVMTHAFLYGTAVFEGIRGYFDPQSGQIFIFRLTEHLERLERSARILKMKLPGPPPELVEITRKLVRDSGFQSDVYIRAIGYKSARRIGMKLDDQEDFTMIVLPMTEKYLPTDVGVHVAVSSWRRMEDNAIPSRAKINGSYVNLALSADEVRSNGFDEALLLNEDGHVAEGAGMNIFLVKGGVLVTPGVEANILEGITRDAIQHLAKLELGIETVVRNVDRTELYTAEEIFLCGTAAEIVPVLTVDRRQVGKAGIGAVTRRLSKLYESAARGKLPAYKSWLVAA